MKNIKLVMIIIIVTLTASYALITSYDADTPKEDSLQSPYDELDINLEQEIFADIYNFPNSYFITDVAVHEASSQVDGDVDIAIKESHDYEAIYELIGFQCLNTTVSESISTENNYDYVVDFKLGYAGGHRNFSISLGESYLLVSLVSESEQLIKHEISRDNYLKLTELLHIEPDKSIAVVKDNLISVDEHIPFILSDEEKILKYLVLKDSNSNDIPLLLKIELEVEDLGDRKSILSSIKNMNIDLFGVSSFEESGEHSNGNYYWEKAFILENDQSISTVDRENLAELKYLENQFSEIRIWDKSENVVTYNSTYPLENYIVKVGIGRDPESKQVYLSVSVENE